MKCREEKNLPDVSPGRLTGLVFVGLILSVFALTPLVSNFLPKSVDYDKTYEFVTLKEGLNKIDDLALTLTSNGKVSVAKKLHSRVTNQVLGFKNVRGFLESGMPFISLLSLCLFFIWCDKRRRDGRAFKLKKVVLTTFLFTAVWFTCRFIIPEPGASPGLYLYYASIYFATAFSLALGYCLYNRYASKRYASEGEPEPSPVPSLIAYLLEIREKHYYRAAVKALENADECEQSCRDLGEYEQQTFEEFKKINANY